VGKIFMLLFGILGPLVVIKTLQVSRHCLQMQYAADGKMLEASRKAFLHILKHLPRSPCRHAELCYWTVATRCGQ
jgi:hypothetical protein